MLLVPYLATRRMFALLLGVERRNLVFKTAGLGSTWDYLTKLMIPVRVRPFIEIKTRFAYEREVVRAVLELRGRTFIDVGANIGYYSVLLSRNFERVLAFEPNPWNLSRLMDTVRVGRLRNIFISSNAVSDADGQAMLFSEERDAHPTAGGGSLEHSSVQKGTIVQTVKLDTILKETVDLVKVDVEGAEWRVLRGAQESMRKRRIVRIIIELHDESRKTELDECLRQAFASTEWLDARHVMATL